MDALVAALIGEDERPDDIAILALRLATAAVDDLRLVVPANRVGLVDMRQAFRSWLSAAGVEEDAAAEIALAVWEAAANAIEHAQEPVRSTFEVGATLADGGILRIEVGDSGRWKPGEGSVDRGLGLTLMRSFMDSLDVRAEDTGTTIVMERRVDVTPGV